MHPHKYTLSGPYLEVCAMIRKEHQIGFFSSASVSFSPVFDRLINYDVQKSEKHSFSRAERNCFAVRAAVSEISFPPLLSF